MVDIVEIYVHWYAGRSKSQVSVRQGANVRFTKTSRILAELVGGHADRTWDKRMRELIRPDLLILDDFAMRQLAASQADDLYELVSERQGRSLIITSNRAPSDWHRPKGPTNKPGRARMADAMVVRHCHRSSLLSPRRDQGGPGA